MNKSKAFTLIEMLVSVTILTLVIGSATGLFISAVRSQVKALASQKLFDEASYIMEYTSRYLRMAKKDTDGTCLTAVGSGYGYEIPVAYRIGGDSNLGTGIKFINYQDVCQEFYLDNGQFKENRGGILDLTSDKLEITSLEFNLSGGGQPPSDYLQPRVTISMTIKKAGATGPKIKIQTTTSQRNLDVRQ